MPEPEGVGCHLRSPLAARNIISPVPSMGRGIFLIFWVKVDRNCLTIEHRWRDRASISIYIA